MAGPQIWRGNLVLLAGATIVPSSEEPGFTRDALLRPGVTDVLRFKLGWDVKTGENDRIDFNRGGVKVATITAGNYATAAAYAAAIVTALELADSTPAWAVTRASDTGLWTIATSLETFTLLFSTGANKARSAALDLGFDESDSAAAATSQVSARAAWQSRKWVNLDAGAALALNRWLIVAGVNDKIDFARGGTKVATVAAGIYESGQALAAAIQAALEAADPTQVWSVFWPGFGNIFVIDNNTPNNFDLLTLTGANAATAMWDEIGFDRTADHTGSSQYFGDNSALGSPLGGQTRALILGHSVSDSGAARLDGHTATFIGVGLGSTGVFSTPLARDPGGSNLRVAQFDVTGLRYWRLIADDTLGGSPTSSRGWVEIGVLFIGATLDLTGIAPELSDARDELSAINYAVEGAHAVVRRGTRRILELRVHRIEDADKLELEAFAAEVRIGGAFFFVLDSADPFGVRYVFLAEGFTFEAVETMPRTWTASIKLLEILG